MRARGLKTYHGLAGPDCQHVVIDEFLCIVSGCTLETNACHWMFKQNQHGPRSRRCPFNTHIYGKSFHSSEYILPAVKADATFIQIVTKFNQPDMQY